MSPLNRNVNTQDCLDMGPPTVSYLPRYSVKADSNQRLHVSDLLLSTDIAAMHGPHSLVYPGN